MIDRKTGHRIETNKRISILMAVVVGTFQQDGFGVKGPEPEVNADRRDRVGKDFPDHRFKINLFHSYLFFYLFLHCLPESPSRCREFFQMAVPGDWHPKKKAHRELMSLLNGCHSAASFHVFRKNLSRHHQLFLFIIILKINKKTCPLGGAGSC